MEKFPQERIAFILLQKCRQKLCFYYRESFPMHTSRFLHFCNGMHSSSSNFPVINSMRKYWWYNKIIQEKYSDGTTLCTTHHRNILKCCKIKERWFAQQIKFLKKKLKTFDTIDNIYQMDKIVSINRDNLDVI